MKAQAGICAEPNLHALYLIFNRTGDAAEELVGCLAKLPALWQAVAADFPEAGFSGLVAVSADAWDRLYPAARPPQFRSFMAQSANGQEAPKPHLISSCSCVPIGWTCCTMPVIA